MDYSYGGDEASKTIMTKKSVIKRVQFLGHGFDSQKKNFFFVYSYGGKKMNDSYGGVNDTY